MPFKWNDTTERMMLIKFVEQNLATKFDVDAALNAWPADLEKPTKRSLGDRFNLIKRNIRDSRVASALGQGSTISSLTTPVHAVPRTPSSNASKTPSKRAKINSNLNAGVPNTFTTFSAKSFTSKLIDGANDAASSIRSTKSSQTSKGRKRKAESESESMSEHESSGTASASSDMEEDADTRTYPATNDVHARRSLPRRSKTPAQYAVDESSDASEDSKDKKKYTGNRGSATLHANGIEQENADEDDEYTDGDGLFDPVAERMSVRDGSKKQKASWKERIALMDGKDDDGAMDLED